jgi:cell surface protein SprA
MSKIVYYGVKVPFLDYENIAFQYTQNTTSNVTGVRGQTGFNAFWSALPFSSPTEASLGPSQLYQLGLITDPNPRSGRLAFTGSFPFIEIRNYERGLRAANPNGSYADNFSQSNNFSLRTSRPLWEGARLDVNWDLRWSVNKNTQFRTDSLGMQTITGVTSTGSIERSYLIMPDFLFFKFFNTNIDEVGRKYTSLKNDAGDTRDQSEKLCQAFEEGFEALPWLSKILRELMPRINWGLRWDGIEKLPFMSWADRISLEHRYTSSMATGYRIDNDNGNRITESKRAQYGFSPLIGLTFGFSKIWGGSMNINTRWASTKTYDLNTSSINIVETGSDEFSLTADFKKTGFEVPFFGLSLKNDIDFSFSFTLNKSSSHTYDVNNLGTGGQPREGTMRITIEPRVRYNISTRVTSSIFYRYSRTKPDASVGSTITGTTVHEGGLELRIQISGS